MICSKCGKPNDDTAVFCNQCGADMPGFASTPVQPQPAPATGRDHPQYPRSERKPKTRIIAVIAGVAVVAAAVFVLFFVLGGESLSGTYVSGRGDEITFSGKNFTMTFGEHMDVSRGTYTLRDGVLSLNVQGESTVITGYYNSAADTVQARRTAFHVYGSNGHALAVRAAEREARIAADGTPPDPAVLIARIILDGPFNPFVSSIAVAAIAPAVLGVINRANEAADQADVRSIMMAGSVVGMSLSPPRTPVIGAVIYGGTSGEMVLGTVTSGNTITISDAILREFTGGVNIQPGNYTIFFDGAVAVGGILDAAHSRTGQQIEVGLASAANAGITAIAIMVYADGTGAEGIPGVLMQDR